MSTFPPIDSSFHLWDLLVFAFAAEVCPEEATFLPVEICTAFSLQA